MKLAMVVIAWQTSLEAQDKLLISGNIIDVVTKEPLPYVTLSLKKQLIGVVTNEEGKFDLYIPKEAGNDTLLVNYLGYKHVLIHVPEIKTPITIQLEQTIVQLEEIVVRPWSPENYIQMAMRKLKENYSGEPFQTEAYYREKILENKNLIKCDEGVFRTFCLNYLDTIRPQNQLLLFRQADNPQKITFMSREQKKKEIKDSVRTANGEENNVNIDLGESFGGPEDILKIGVIGRNPEDFLDSTQFKSYKYSFSKSSSYNTGEVLVIDFASKGKVNYKREAGKIYIDLASLAIVKIECKGNFIIPAIVKPILFFLSFSIKNPTYEKTTEFQKANGKWYPKNIQNNIDLKLSNKHLFRKDERSDFEIEQFFTVNELKTENPQQIPETKRFVAKKEMEKQVFNDGGLTWEGLNIIKPQGGK